MLSYLEAESESGLIAAGDDGGYSPALCPLRTSHAHHAFTGTYALDWPSPLSIRRRVQIPQARRHALPHLLS